MRTFIIIFLFSAIGLSCTQSKNDFAPEASMEMGRMMEQPLTSKAQPPAEPVLYERKVIKTADIQFEVAGVHDALKEIKSKLAGHNGYISEENEETSGNRHTYNLIIRVPNQDFDSLVDLVTKDRLKVDYKRISSEDVSEQYYDILTRLENEKEIEKRYLELLNKARSVSDILEIEREVGKIRSEIESKEGIIKRLENRIAFSTINLRFYQVIDYKFIPENRPGFIERIKESLHSGWRGFVSFTIFLFKIWPLILIVFVGIYFFRKRAKKRKNKKVKE